MFVGKFPSKIDSKNRCTIPKKFIDEVASGSEGSKVFYLHRGFHNHCLFLYTEESWAKHIKPIAKNIGAYDDTRREALRAYLNGAEKIRTDSANRLTLSKSMLEKAGIDKEVQICGMLNYFEIWSKDRYDKKYGDQTPADHKANYSAAKKKNGERMEDK